MHYKVMDSRILQLASKDFYNLLVYCSIFSEEIGLANSWKSLVVRHEIVAFILTCFPLYRNESTDLL